MRQVLIVAALLALCSACAGAQLQYSLTATVTSPLDGWVYYTSSTMMVDAESSQTVGITNGQAFQQLSISYVGHVMLANFVGTIATGGQFGFNNYTLNANGEWSRSFTCSGYSDYLSDGAYGMQADVALTIGGGDSVGTLSETNLFSICWGGP